MWDLLSSSIHFFSYMHVSRSHKQNVNIPWTSRLVTSKTNMYKECMIVSFKQTSKTTFRTKRRRQSGNLYFLMIFCMSSKLALRGVWNVRTSDNNFVHFSRYVITKTTTKTTLTTKESILFSATTLQPYLVFFNQNQSQHSKQNT